MSCPNYTDYKNIYHIAMHSSTIITVPFNCFGVYCIVFKSPPEMRPYCWYLVTHQIFANGLDFLLTVLTLPVYNFYPAFSGYPDGLFTWLNVPLLFQNYPTYCWAGGVQASTVVVFLYRHQVVLPANHRRKLPRSPAFYSPICILFFCVWWGIAIFLTVPSPNNLQAAVKEIAALYECVPENFLHPNVITTVRGKGPILYSMAISIVVITVVLVLGMTFDVSNALQGMHSTMSKKSRMLQKAFMKTLILQCCIPLGLLLLPFMVTAVSIHLEYHNPNVPYVLVFALSTHGFAGTIAMLLLNTPYRKYIVSLLSHVFPRLKKKTNKKAIFVPSSIVVAI